MARGRLRIYLGAAPGVGKTFAMLSEGQRRAARGTDVVVALCETHARPHTVEALDGLEVIPRRTITHRGVQMEEMDLDAVLARRPEVALVDELAHTNVPGSRHEKRWQDIEELLAAGIDVVSTVNIQHLESLNDAVEDITGIAQQETVPDQVVRGADQIELVDMSPEALRRRMAHGNIYRAEKVDAALSNYFRIGNLGALRELALLWLADRVDEALALYRDDHDIAGAWPARERVLVALSGGPEGAALLRRGARIASRGAGVELHAVYVARADGLAGPSLPDVVTLRRLCEELGGTFHAVTGDDAAEAVLEFAKALNTTQIVVGASRRPTWRRLLGAGAGESIIAGAGDIDVLVVNHAFASGEHYRRARAALPRSRVFLGVAFALAGPIALTALLTVISHVGLPLIMLVYLMMTVLVALVGGMAPALLAAAVSSLLINWFFAPPLHTLTIARPENVVAIVFFFAIAAAVSTVVHRSARRAAAALEAQHESSTLAEMTHTLLGATDQMSLLLSRAVDMFGADAAAIVRRPTREHPEATVVDATDAWADTAYDDASACEPADGAHDLVLSGALPAADDQRLLAAFAAHAGAILHRRALQRSAAGADDLARDNRARTALLSAVSHDLRTPLAAVKAAIGSLRSTEVTFEADDRAELESVIEDAADRLGDLIDNLLDMSRLQAGALVAHPRTVDLGEVVPTVVKSMGDADAVRWTLPDDARRVVADPGLLDRVLGNVIENAVRHSPQGTDVYVTSSRLGRVTEVRVIDRGPGVSEEQRESMFVPFQRLGDVPAGSGVGLGLAVARGLAEAMGGTIEAEDTPGGGVTVVVSLPTQTDPRGEP